MSQTLTNFDAALKETYGPGLRNAINDKIRVLSEVSRNMATFIGREVVWSLHHGRSSGTGARAEGGSLPTAGFQAYEDPRDALKYQYHTIKVSGQALRLSQGDEGAFTRALESEMKGAQADLKNDYSRQVFGTLQDGKTGSMALTTTGGSTTTIVLASTTTQAEMRGFFVGMWVAVVDPTTDAIHETKNVRVTAINKSTKTLTVDDGSGGAAFAAAPPTGDAVVRADNVRSTSLTIGSTNWENEILGLRALLDDDGTVTIHGLDGDTVDAWSTPVTGDGTQPLDEDLIEQAFDAVDTDGNGDQDAVRLVFWSYENKRTLINRLQTLKRYINQAAVTPVAGWKGVELANGSVGVVDKYCPDDIVFGVNPDEISWQVAPDANFAWDDRDGKVLFKALDGSDAYEARLLTYAELLALVRNAHFRIDTSSPV